MREKLIELTGRSDLRLEDAVGRKRADFYLNAGLRLLDKQVKNPNTEAWYIPTELTTAGDYIFKVKHARFIKEVWLIEDSTEGEAKRTRLKATTARWLRSNYSYPSSSSTYGIPVYWAPISIGLSPEQYSLATTAHDDVPDTNHIQYMEDTFPQSPVYARPESNPFVYKAVMLAPACQADVSIHLLVDFLSRPLTDETDMNFWTLNYPEALVLAAASRLESFLRNETGAQEYKNQALEIAYGIDMDMAEGEVGTDDDLQMDSGWDY